MIKVTDSRGAAIYLAADAIASIQQAGASSAWEPPRPEGEGWFVLSIHDTEDWGPVCVWVRHAAKQGKGGA